MANYSENPVDFLNAKKEKLAGVLTLPKYTTNLPAVIICHGFAKTKSDRKFVELSRFLADKGVASLRFDFSGHGESEGDFEKMTIQKESGDLAYAFGFLSKQKRINSSKIAIIGHSLGCVAAVSFQAQCQKANTLILLAPALQQKELISGWYSKKQIALCQKEKYADAPRGRIGLGYLEGALAFEWREIIEKIASPVLIIHGQKDEDVPLKYSRELFRAIKADKKLEIIETADHGLESYQAKRETLTYSYNWLKKKLL
ncbi:MAG: alpha/beta hydrolase [Candidatus Pacebacteria bacterium]|nr:alpha/beta hydrolase [Candidatus Paceibacterota bacterium]